MKPGGMLLFVDNAAGGFDRMIRETASDCGMVTVFGPLKHYDYENTSFNVKRYGNNSQFKTRVSVEMWKKPMAYNATQQLQYEYMHGPRRVTRNRSNTSHQNIRLESNTHNEEEGCCSII